MNSQSDNYKFTAKLGNLKTVLHMLKAINFKETATCYCTENGLKVTVEEAKCMQASAYIGFDVFNEFNLKEDVIFQINLTILVECLSMFWANIAAHTNSVMQLFYKGEGHPVSIFMEEDGIITDCSLKTQEPEQLIDFYLERENVLNKIVLETALLRDVLSELDPTSDLIELLLSPDPPYFRISTGSVAGECRSEIPRDSDLIDVFQCHATATSSYKLAHIKPVTKAFAHSTKLSLRTDQYGLLCFQFMLKTEEGRTCYIDYYISPVIDAED